MTTTPTTTLIKTYFFIISLTIGFSSHATTLTVKQDGTGDYILIQNAIIASADGDTVLVWPGTYYENIDFVGKNITLASLMLTTGDEAYKHNTIIDGNKNGSCVAVMSGETNAILNGFTLQHGSGTNFAHPVLHNGGGVIITYASCYIYNCIITNNTIDGSGGGIYSSFSSHLFLSNTSIFNNHAYQKAGGIIHGYESTIEFDSINYCNLYSNYSAYGCDFLKGDDGPLIMYLDTCTVLNPDNYYISSVDQYGYPLNDIVFNIQNQYITPKDADLYVNPQTGDNNNSGITPNDPLRSIAFAYSSIVIDSSNKNTIHLANGIYSDSANNEKFPLNIRPYINIVGESRNNTILDGMYKSQILKGNNQISNYNFSKLTMQRGGHVYYNTDSNPAGFVFLYIENDNIVFDSVLFKDGHGYPYRGQFHIESSNNVQIRNCEFKDNIGAYTVRVGANSGDTVTISNCIFSNNMPDYLQQEKIGGALIIYAFNTTYLAQGCLFTGNNNYNVVTTGEFSGHAGYFINCTFTDNTKLNDNVSISIIDASSNMYNCIVYNEGSSEPITLFWNVALETITLNIYNSLIENGVESIYVRPGAATLHYDETNIEGDPLFYGGAEYPYNLSDLSPCIDAGTLDLPDWIELPEFDLAGNPRIVGGAIDMGAYEWNPTVGVNEYQPIKKQKERLLSVAPNPFTTSTIISTSYPVKSHVKLDIYNNNGLRVKALMDEITLPGASHIVWNGDDSNNHALPTGIYHVVMFVDEKEIESVKVVKR